MVSLYWVPPQGCVRKAPKAIDQWKQVPVVMICTEGSQAKVMEALRLGAKGFIRKPFIPDDIGDKLAGLVQGSRGRRRELF